jgi:hypothetical protein
MAEAAAASSSSACGPEYQGKQPDERDQDAGGQQQGSALIQGTDLGGLNRALTPRRGLPRREARSVAGERTDRNVVLTDQPRQVLGEFRYRAVNAHHTTWR